MLKKNGKKKIARNAIQKKAVRNRLQFLGLNRIR